MKQNPSTIIKQTTRHIIAIDASWVVLKCFKVLNLSWGLTLAPLIFLFTLKLVIFFIFLSHHIITKKRHGKV